MSSESRSEWWWSGLTWARRAEGWWWPRSPVEEIRSVEALAVVLAEVGVALKNETRLRRGRRRQTRHVPQRMTWDCGLACALMVRDEASWDEALRCSGTRSVWTVDLVAVLRAWGLARFVFLTKTIGADPSHGRLSFYSADYASDRRRVDARFAEFRRWIRRATLSSDVLLEVLARGLLVLALIDLRVLRASEDDYTGHYILLIGLDDRGHVLYRDPAAADPILAIAPELLHTARTAHGTDDDLILIETDDEDPTDETAAGSCRDE
mmetsp:Transcript_10648/g.32017  ORF Transcript_10648/g.32017 Transcript_10648/m.32017 type:complete len:266 (+) Transcript_10648:116-913(+)